MKKRLEAELISIAHRILKLKNKSEVDQLYLETRKLYETLSVLKFYSDNYEQIKSEITIEVIEEKISVALEEKVVEEVSTANIQETVIEKSIIETIKEPEVEIKQEEVQEKPEIEVAPEEIQPEIDEVLEKIEKNDEVIVEEPKEEKAETSENLIFEPIFELEEEEEEAEERVEEKTEVLVKNQPQQISFEDLLGANYIDPVFVKADEVTSHVAEKTKEEKEEVNPTKEIQEVVEEKPFILNEKLPKGINIGLNDRVGFVKYLFADSNEDFNRVLSQLNTFDTYKDAKKFIAEMVKPDYNNWKGQEDFEERFMELVERKFN